MDYSLPGCSAHGTYPGKNSGVGCHATHQTIFNNLLQNYVNLELSILICHSRYLGSSNSIYVYVFQVALVVKNLPANAEDIRDAGSIPELGRSPGEGNGNLLQYSCLENPMDNWQAIVHKVA